MKRTILTLALIIFNLNVFSQAETIAVWHERNSDNSVDFYFEKSEPGSFLLSVKFKSVDNSYTDDYLGVVKLNSGKVLSLRPIVKYNPISFSYTYSFMRGVLNPKVDLSFVYVFPFAKGKMVLVNELNYLGRSHMNNEKPKNWKAYQLVSFDTDTIFASRKGLVVKVIDDFELDTVNYFLSEKNEILVEHSDGTFASYSGFKKNNLFVEKGQVVYPQTPLGISEKDKDSNISRLIFKINFLIDSDSKSNETLISRRGRYEYLTPLFYTSEGKAKLEPRTSYTVDFDEDILLYEFTKKEIRKYRKSNLN